MAKIKQIDVKKLEDKLIKDAGLIEETFNWHQYETVKLVAKLSSAVRKLEETMDDSWIVKIEQYQKELNNLQLKAQWEEKEIIKYNKNQAKLDDLKKKIFIHKLSNRLKKIK